MSQQSRAPRQASCIPQHNEGPPGLYPRGPSRYFARQKSLFALKPFHVDAVFADLRPEGTRIEAEEFGSAVLSGDFAVGAVERLDDIIDGDLVECLEWFRIVLVPLAVRLLLALRGREVKSAVGRIFGKDVQEIIDKDRLDAGTDLEMFLRILSTPIDITTIVTLVSLSMLNFKGMYTADVSVL